ncbi:MAG TPA: hypothetical protein P5181_03065 [Dermatophilaceae bacterium]|nr:hypothetical protein [Dermatophilaceae bacterium]
MYSSAAALFGVVFGVVNLALLVAAMIAAAQRLDRGKGLMLGGLGVLLVNQLLGVFSGAAFAVGVSAFTAVGWVTRFAATVGFGLIAAALWQQRSGRFAAPWEQAYGSPGAGPAAPWSAGSPWGTAPTPATPTTPGGAPTSAQPPAGGGFDPSQPPQRPGAQPPQHPWQ